MSRVVNKFWKRAYIDEVKARIRQELAPFPEAHERYPFLLTRIEATDDEKPDRLLYILTALHTHVREGGLIESQVKELFQLAEALVTLQNIRPKVSEAAFLLGELHILRAQLYMSQGEPLLACIEQQLVENFSGPQLPGGPSFQSLSLARMSLRLGEAGLALNYLQQALKDNLDAKLQPAALMLKLRALRLHHRWDEAEALSAELLRLPQEDPRWLREIQWEKLCRQVYHSGSIDELMRNMNPRRDFYQASYILESFFWIRAVSTIQWMDHLPKLKSLNQKKTLNFRPLATFHRCAMHVERLYDKEIPPAHRLLLVKKIAQTMNGLADIDKLLLVLLSLVRWLIRSQYRELARIIFTEYVQLSRRLSGSPDVLGIAADLNARFAEEIA